MAVRVVIAPDSFKGSLGATQVARALATGWRRYRPDDDVRRVPVADGGEGTVEALVGAWRGRFVDAKVTDPLGQEVIARFGVSADGTTAVIETAAASGLVLVPRRRRNPLVTTTYGTGELIKAALDLGVRRIVIGLGGSATNDGGSGMAAALGVRFLDERGEPLPPGGGALARLATLDTSAIDPRIENTEFVAATDVDNPLLGERGASHVFGPQKGGDPRTIGRLEQALSHYATVVSPASASVPGAGAAGGLGFGLAVFCAADVRSGAHVVLDAVGLHEQLADADVVITGEGRLDGQSVYGKAPLAVARAAREYDKPVIAVAGILGPDYEQLYEHGITAALSIAPGPIDWKTSIRQARPLLVACGERIARLVSVGLPPDRRKPG